MVMEVLYDTFCNIITSLNYMGIMHTNIWMPGHMYTYTCNVLTVPEYMLIAYKAEDVATLIKLIR